MAIEETEISEWLFDLFYRRDALGRYEESLLSLARNCHDREEFEVLMHTVERLIALSQPQLTNQINRMVAHITKLVEQDEKFAIVAMAWGEEPDSSQHLIQLIKVKFHKYKNVKFFNSVNSFEKKDNMREYSKFILIDDFSGTGSTIIIRAKHLLNHSKNLQVEVNMHVCLLFGMNDALKNVMDAGFSVHFCSTLKAGISGYFAGEERDRKIALMKKLEAGLQEKVNDKTLPSLGYGAAEALFFIQDSNAPNSNFPIFWWPIDKRGNERNTLMQRAEL